MLLLWHFALHIVFVLQFKITAVKILFPLNSLTHEIILSILIVNALLVQNSIYCLTSIALHIH